MIDAEQNLQSLGLNKTQAKIYLYLLTIKQATPSAISVAVSENRTTVYMVLSKLEETSLVSKSDTVKGSFCAENPAKLRSLLAQRQQDLKSSQLAFSALLPKLNQLYVVSHQKPGVVYLEGVDGLKAVYDEIVAQKSDFIILPSIYSRSDPEMDSLIDRNIRLQKKNNIHARTLYPVSMRETTNVEELTSNNVTVRFFGQDVHHTAQLLIFGNSVAITTFEQGIFTTMITDASVAHTHRGYFESMWSSAEGEAARDCSSK